MVSALVEFSLKGETTLKAANTTTVEPRFWNTSHLKQLASQTDNPSTLIPV